MCVLSLPMDETPRREIRMSGSPAHFTAAQPSREREREAAAGHRRGRDGVEELQMWTRRRPAGGGVEEDDGPAGRKQSKSDTMKDEAKN